MSATRLVLGVGCTRGATPAALRDLVATTLARHDIATADIALIASLESKADEAAIHALGHGIDRPLRFFPAARLLAETARLAHPSDAVFRAVGCYGVAEAAALAAAGPDATLIVPKQNGDGVTCALAAP